MSAHSGRIGQLNLLSMNLLLVCTLADATRAIASIVATLIFIIVSLLRALFLVVAVRSFLHALVAVACGDLSLPTMLLESNANGGLIVVTNQIFALE